MLDALAVGGGISQFNTSYVYVVRKVTGKEPMVQPVTPAPAEPKDRPLQLSPEQEMLEIIAPRAHRGWLGSNGFVVTVSEMITDSELAEAAMPEGFETSNDTGQDRLENEQQARPIRSDRETIDKPIEDTNGRIEWIFQDGKWVPVRIGAKPKTPAAEALPQQRIEELKERIPETFDWDDIGTGGVQTRVIKIPTDKLRGGDSRYNIVIKPADSIQVPVDIIGEFSIMGNVNGQGFINLTGRPMTLKMAIAAAGGLGPLAWPKNCEVVRRIGKKKEETVWVDLDKIASGEQPDFFIKPNDLINVGTHSTARWRAVLRNAFRATYGFGFIYDRNFADRDFGTSRPIPNWF